jgi:hypothetical protein
MNWILWLKGLAAVAIGGAATGAATALSTGQLNKNAAITAGIGALSTPTWSNRRWSRARASPPRHKMALRCHRPAFQT